MMIATLIAKSLNIKKERPMMIFALPVKEDRISPVFDTCSKVLVVKVEEGKEISREEVSLEKLSRFERASKLKNLGVEVLLCGAVSRMVWAQLETMGVLVFPWVAGPVDEVISAFLGEKLPDPEYMLPGCFGFGRRRRCRGWGQGPWGPPPWKGRFFGF